MRSAFEWNLWNLENDAHDAETIGERARRLGEVDLYRRALAGEPEAELEACRRDAAAAAELAADYRAEARLHG